MNKDDISKWIHMAWDFTNEENVKRKFEYQEAHYMPYEKFAKLVAGHERSMSASLSLKQLMSLWAWKVIVTRCFQRATTMR
jgi:hypothetical protein